MKQEEDIVRHFYKDGIFFSTSFTVETRKVGRSFDCTLVITLIIHTAVLHQHNHFRYTLSSINGIPVLGSKIVFNGQEQAVLDILADQANYPLNIRFQPPTITTNEKIILSSTFHSLYTIAAQLSPVSKSTGIEVLTTSQFK